MSGYTLPASSLQYVAAFVFTGSLDNNLGTGMPNWCCNATLGVFNMLSILVSLILDILDNGVAIACLNNCVVPMFHSIILKCQKYKAGTTKLKKVNFIDLLVRSTSDRIMEKFKVVPEFGQFSPEKTGMITLLLHDHI